MIKPTFPGVISMDLTEYELMAQGHLVSEGCSLAAWKILAHNQLVLNHKLNKIIKLIKKTK